MSNRQDQYLRSGLEAIAAEKEMLGLLESRLDQSFSSAAALIHNCKGKIVVTGIGKSGLIGAKIAATLSSLGSPACFLHAAEAVHGDLGLIQPLDVIIAISNSGETGEIVNLLGALVKLNNPLIAMTGNPESTLGRNADVVLNISVPKEADHLNLAPTCSATVTLALGDALAVAVARARNFSSDDFHKFHPGGALGLMLRKGKDKNGE